MLKFKGLYILLVSAVQGVEGARSSEVTGGVALNQRTQMPSLLAAGIPLWLQMPRMCGTNPQDLVRFPPHLLPALTHPPFPNCLLAPSSLLFLPSFTHLSSSSSSQACACVSLCDYEPLLVVSAPPLPTH